MKPYFQTEESIARLTYHATLWIGTPWFPNSAARGERGGVSCHNLPRSIYIETGFLTEAFPKVIGDPNGTKHKTESVMEKFLDGRPEFERLPIGAPLQPGDLLGIRIFYCIDHLGVLLDASRFIHVLKRKKTALNQISDATWLQRILCAWRPAV